MRGSACNPEAGPLTLPSGPVTAESPDRGLVWPPPAPSPRLLLEGLDGLHPGCVLVTASLAVPERGRRGLRGDRGAGTWGSAPAHLGIRLAWPCRRDLPPLLTKSAPGEQPPHVLEASMGFSESPPGPGALGQPSPHFLCAEGLRGWVCTGEPPCGLRGHSGQPVAQFTADAASASEAACEPGRLRHPAGSCFQKVLASHEHQRLAFGAQAWG